MQGDIRNTPVTPRTNRLHHSHISSVSATDLGDLEIMLPYFGERKGGGGETEKEVKEGG